MPTMANIVVKKNDNVTDVTYDMLSASSGDKSPAVWRQDTGQVATLPVGLRPTLTVEGKWNGSKTARQMPVKYVYPYAVQNSTTTLWSSAGEVVFSGMLTAPQNLPASVINEAVAQGFNLMASTLMKAQAQAGYAAT